MLRDPAFLKCLEQNSGILFLLLLLLLLLVPCRISLGRIVSASTLVPSHDKSKTQERLQVLFWIGASV